MGEECKIRDPPIDCGCGFRRYMKRWGFQMEKMPKGKAVRKAFDRLHDRGKAVVKDKIAKAKSERLRMTITWGTRLNLLSGRTGRADRGMNLVFVEWVTKDWDIEEI